MVFGRKERTTKEVGKSIGRDISDIKKKEKIIRTLEKEEVVKKKRRELEERIKKLKSQRPSGFQKFGRVLAKTGKRTFKELKKAGANIREAERKESRFVKKKSKKFRKKFKKQQTSQRNELSFVDDFG